MLCICICKFHASVGLRDCAIKLVYVGQMVYMECVPLPEEDTEKTDPTYTPQPTTDDDNTPGALHRTRAHTKRVIAYKAKKLAKAATTRYA